MVLLVIGTVEGLDNRRKQQRKVLVTPRGFGEVRSGLHHGILKIGVVDRQGVGRQI